MSATRSAGRCPRCWRTALRASPVVSMDGMALSGATVVASQMTYGYHEWRATTDGDGSFRLVGLMPGVRALVWAEKAGWYVADGAMALDPATGASPLAPTLRMHRAARVQGVLTATSGRPLHGASVWVAVVTGRLEEGGRSVEEATPRLPVRSDGSYEAPVAATTEGEFTVVASAPGFREARSRPIKIVAGQEVYVVDLPLAEAHGIRGRVVAMGTGVAIPGARIGIGQRTDLAFATTDRDGRFAIESLVPF